ncbi:MAG TPA: MBOAT family protein [Burkholderiales bacterium]|nr:MBOAT family protein [Burkholderiales bacterium]
MLFNSQEFIFLYLPIVFAAFYALGAHSRRVAAGWLVLASVFFYGWWAAAYVLLLLTSITTNFTFGVLLARDGNSSRQRAALLVVAVGLNLLLLGYYKYAGFFANALSSLSGTQLRIAEVVLPLGISFFTFTQIAFLVDTYKGYVKDFNFIHYALFVTYFPHLIAGPILHHKEMMPQFAKPETYRLDAARVAVGLTIFGFGLFKKVVLADNVAPYVGPVFDAPGFQPTLIEAWGGALAYTAQLYFDFSGYCDMAVGLSLLFGVRLPLNFNSPYKAVNISDFWRRWHMTLSRFLRDYLYIPLGGNRKGPTRRNVNLMATMLLGGLWHGAGWTFVAWGGLHGLYLAINHAWRHMRSRAGHDLERTTFAGRLAGRLVTFIAVVFAWVLFRASDMASAGNIMAGMIGLNGLEFSRLPAFFWPNQPLWTGVCLAIAFFLPNVAQMMRAYRPVLDKVAAERERYELRAAWRPTLGWVALSATLTWIAVLGVSKVSPFLYFQF